MLDKNILIGSMYAANNVPRINPVTVAVKPIVKPVKKNDLTINSLLFEFINMFAPHLKKEIVAKACSTKSKKELDKVFESIKLLRR